MAVGGLPIVKVLTGGLAVTETTRGMPVAESANRLGIPVRFVASGGIPVTSVGYTFIDMNAKAYVAAMTVQPSNALKAAIDASFIRMKLQTYWAKDDWLSFALHDEQASRINAKNPAQIATKVGSPGFVAFKGFSCDASNYIDLGQTLSTAGGGYSLNSCHAAIWNYTSDAANGNGAITDLDAGTAQIWTNYSFVFYVRSNESTLITNPATCALGHHGFSRTGSTLTTSYRHGLPLGTNAAPSVAVPASSFKLKGVRRQCAIHYGAGLSDAEWAAQRADIAQFLNESGIIPAFDIFLVVGDSNNHNGVGYDAVIDVSHPDVWANNYINGSGYIEEPIRAVNPNWFLGGPIGYDVAFLRDFYIPNARLPQGHKALIIKASVSGSGLFTASQEWRPTKTAYVNAVTLTNYALACFPNAVFKGILGCEGANDATANADATLFQTQYDAMLTGLRTDITGASAVPIVMAGIPPKYLATGTAATLQPKISSMPSRLLHAGYADNSSPTVLNHTSDPIHYDAQDDRGTLGAPGGMAGRFWTAWQALT